MGVFDRIFSSLAGKAGDPDVDVLDDLGQVIARTRVGDAPVDLPEGSYILVIGNDDDGDDDDDDDDDDLVPRQYVEEGLDVRSQILMVQSFRMNGRRHYGAGFTPERPHDRGGPSSNTKYSREPEGALEAVWHQSEDGREVERLCENPFHRIAMV